MSLFYFNSFFVIVFYIISKHNASIYPVAYVKLQKSLYGIVRFTVPATLSLAVMRLHAYQRQKAEH